MSKPVPHTHVVFGSVGGTGKTTIAAGLADYFQSRGQKVLCWNGDPLCPGIEEYAGLEVRRLSWQLCDLAQNGVALEKAAGSAERISIIDLGPTTIAGVGEWISNRNCKLPDGWQLHLPLTRSRLRDSAYMLRYVLHCHYPTLPVVLWLNQLHGLLSAQDAFHALSLWPEETQGTITFDDLSWGLMHEDFRSLVRSTFTLAKDHYQTDKRAQQRLAMAQQKLKKALDGLYGPQPRQPKATDKKAVRTL